VEFQWGRHTKREKKLEKIMLSGKSHFPAEGQLNKDQYRQF